MKDISVRNAEQVGAAVRAKRKESGLSQNRLAELIGVDRKWVIRLEAGNPGAEIGLVLELLKALNLRATLIDQEEQPRSEGFRASSSQLDEVFRQLQRPARK